MRKGCAGVGVTVLTEVEVKKGSKVVVLVVLYESVGLVLLQLLVFEIVVQLLFSEVVKSVVVYSEWVVLDIG